MPGTHVALLRGINVGKARRVAMADLRALVESLGYTQVKTLLNSGNVVFTATGARAAAAAARIEERLATRLEVPARVLVLTADELSSLVSENTLHVVSTNHSRLLVSVLFDPGDRRRLLPLAKQRWGTERLVVGERAVFLWCPAGFLESELRKAVDDVLGDATTTRNWATILKLHALVA